MYVICGYFFVYVFCFDISWCVSYFFVKKLDNNLEAVLHSFAGGVMIASSIFSLIIPAIDYCEELNLRAWFILPICFIFAGVVIWLLNFVSKEKKESKINVFTLNLGIALHNIPEGMCVGFAFASASIFATSSAFLQAVMITVGIGTQNIPEGSSVSFPLYSNGYSKVKAFAISSLVGFLEVPAGIIAYLIGLNYVVILPYMLSFSAGIMISVAVLDLLPEAVDKNKHLANICFFVGFLLMMILDLAL